VPSTLGNQVSRPRLNGIQNLRDPGDFPLGFFIVVFRSAKERSRHADSRQRRSRQSEQKHQDEKRQVQHENDNSKNAAVSPKGTLGLNKRRYCFQIRVGGGSGCLGSPEYQVGRYQITKKRNRTKQQANQQGAYQRCSTKPQDDNLHDRKQEHQPGGEKPKHGKKSLPIRQRSQ
jgi:hypothetical protein